MIRYIVTSLVSLLLIASCDSEVTVSRPGESEQGAALSGTEFREIVLVGATQSSTDFSGAATRAIDGKTNGRYSNGSVTHTRNTNQPWWYARHSRNTFFSEIRIWNRTDGCCSGRLTNFYVFLSDSRFDDNATVADLLADPEVFSHYHAGSPGNAVTIPVNRHARHIRIQLAGRGTLSLAEVKAYVALSNNVRRPDRVESNEEAANFLIQATYGPTEAAIQELKSLGYSNWFKQQYGLEPDYFLDDVIQLQEEDGGNSNLRWQRLSLEEFLWKAQHAQDQLRQRAHFALSEILVTGTGSSARKASMHASYKDVMVKHAFGNFRDLLQDVTYHPMMGNWLTYVNNYPSDPATGARPDENYAREVMQLFTIGLEELNHDGTPKLLGGETIPTYGMSDIEELSKVFTGLHYSGKNFGQRNSVQNNNTTDVAPMVMDNNFHEPGSKTFLGETVPDYGDGNETISHALDILFNHPNVAPFIGKQLIQRMTTSNPSPEYVSRVSAAFDSGRYQLPNGQSVGNGNRGQLIPVWAAILFDEEARADERFENTDFGNTWGKVRNPYLRFIHWMRVADTEGTYSKWMLSFSGIGPAPYASDTVFNFYRPGYMQPGSQTATAGLVAPELQITNGTNVITNYNVMYGLTHGGGIQGSYIPDYGRDIVLAASPVQYVNYLDLVYTANQLTDTTRANILATIEAIEVNPDWPTAWRTNAQEERAKQATMLIMTAPEFIVQR